MIKKLVGIIIYGIRRAESLSGTIRKDSNPALLYTVIPAETSSEKTENQLNQLMEVLPCYGDERGGASITSLKRLFHLPYPDSTKLTDPSLFIKGINRYIFPMEVR